MVIAVVVGKIGKGREIFIAVLLCGLCGEIDGRKIGGKREGETRCHNIHWSWPASIVSGLLSYRTLALEWLLRDKFFSSFCWTNSYDITSHDPTA